MPQKFADLTPEQRERARARSRAGVAKWRAKNKTEARRREKRQAWLRQGIDPSEAERAIDANDGKCDCCGKTFKSSYYRHVDHDHKKGRVRGILCADCNVGIGRLSDHIDGVQKAVDYLKRSERGHV